MLSSNEKFNVSNELDTIGTRHSAEKEEAYTQVDNLFAGLKMAQKRCRHMWENDTDATYTINGGKRTCAICGKRM